MRRASMVLRRLAPALLVTALALWLIWPAPIGTMPLSQDHTVHLARAWMYGQLLDTGHIRGWSSYWYFGFPLGELYPVTGDVLCAMIRAASFGLLSWANSYALAFTLGYLVQGLALLRIGRALGLGVVPGTIAAALLYLDPGVLREGGWAYTVRFGVWLQPVACALLWWAFAELAMLLQRPLGAPGTRRYVLPAVLLGVALLSHPIILPVLALASLLFVAVMGFRQSPGRVLVATGMSVAIGGMLAAWWVLPLLSNRHWMANFGVLYSNLSTMLLRVLGGAWAKNMWPTIGFAILAGLVWFIARGNRFAKFTAVFSLMLWLVSTSDLFFSLRLDWLSESFRYLQYQRFIICAKPGLYLAAGAALVVLARFARARLTLAGATGKQKAARAAGAVVVSAAIASVGVGAVIQAWTHDVGELRVERVPGDAKFEKTWRDAGEWARKTFAKRDEFFRFAYRARRHNHIFADAPVYSYAPAYKLGFTPGEVFLHKLESDQAPVLDRLRVRYLIGTNNLGRGKVIKRFGRIKVVERKVTEKVARLSGEGTLTVLEDDPDHRGVTVQVEGSAPGDRLEFNIAGYPRWELLHDGVPVEWYEVPVVGKGRIATQAGRRAGDFRAGSTQAPSAKDPMLLAVDAEDGVYELRYRRWLPADILGAAATGLAALLCALWLFLHARGARALEWLGAKIRPRVVVALGVVFALALLARYGAGFMSERGLASGWLRVFRAREVTGLHNGPLQVERLIGPAVLIEAAVDQPASMVLPGVPVRDPIEGYVAVDDGDIKGAKGKKIEALVEGRVAGGGEGDWVELTRKAVAARNGRQKLEIPTTEFADYDRIDLRVTVKVDKSKTPRMGFDIDLR